MHHYSAIDIVPFARLGPIPHEGGPLFPDWEEEPTSRFFRTEGKPADIYPSVTHRQTTPSVVIDKPALWLGPVFPHFGHQIADFSTRLLESVRYGELLGECDFIVGCRSTESKLLDFQKQIYEWYGIDHNQLVFANVPIRARELHVAAQAELLWGREPPHSNYIESLKDIQDSRLDSYCAGATVYVSRAASKAGKIGGEAWLEWVLGTHGVTVIRPEALPIERQLNIYASADTLIFSEGSAVHALQLLGRVGAVHILKRRPGNPSRYGYNFLEHLLAPRCSELHYHSLCHLMHYHIDNLGRHRLEKGISIPMESKLIDFVSDFDVTPSERQIRMLSDFIAVDEENWLGHYKRCKVVRGHTLTNKQTIRPD